MPSRLFYRPQDDSTSSTSSSDESVVPSNLSPTGVGSLEQDDNTLNFSRIVTLSSEADQESPSGVVAAQPGAFSQPDVLPTTQVSHTDMLLHALLEERCTRQITEELNTADETGRLYTSQDPEVRQRSKAMYNALTHQLHHLGMIGRSVNSERHSSIRSTYRSGLDLLTAQLSPNLARPNIDTALATNAIDFSGPSSDMLDLIVNNTNKSLALRRPLLPANLLQENALFAMLDPMRYQRDFREVACIGKGGYGAVFRAEHRLDGIHYAIKKIPVNESRMRKIKERGQGECDKLLMELRTLARLDHPNIARYHSGWLEYNAAHLLHTSPVLSESGQGLLQERSHSPDDISGVHTLAVGKSTEHNQHSSHSDRIVFEASEDPEVATVVDTTSADGPQSPPLPDRRGTFSSVQSTASKRSNGTRASVEDDDAELLPRVINRRALGDRSPASITLDTITSSAVVSDSSADGSQRHVVPVLTLNLQMSLYPLTLSQYLSGSKQPAQSTRAYTQSSAATETLFRHCFHTLPSLRIFANLLDGVGYLHSEGLIHRDLKPANIFISLSTRAATSTPLVSRHDCSRCSVPEAEAQPLFMNFRIGDFGLVATDTAESFATDMSRVVGTEHYRPGARHTIAGPALDIFALGVILLELLCPFGTVMERHLALASLKAGVLPASFKQNVDIVEEDLGQLILRMTGMATCMQMTVKDLQDTIQGLIDKCKCEAA